MSVFLVNGVKIMKINSILDQIEHGYINLPEFQRGYVWNREQIRRLMDSLYRRHPIGGFLGWDVPTQQEGSINKNVELLLDGQQRVTTLYRIVKGKTPRFFRGNENVFGNLKFHLRNEVFEFDQPIKMKNDPLWIDVTQLFKGDPVEIWEPLTKICGNDTELLKRLNKLYFIKDIDLHIDKITGSEMTTDVVVEIFNNINLGGTKLSKGDLALAKVCSIWPDARNKINERLEYWARNQFNFKTELVLRCVTTVLTGKAYFSELEGVESQFEEGLQKTVKHIDEALNLIGDRLGLDHDQVLGGRYALPLITKFFENSGGKVLDPVIRDKLLYWYIQSFLWGRYSGSTETTLSQDLESLRQSDNEMQPLIDKLSQSRGSLNVTPDDFNSWSKGSRFYPLLYMLTRVYGARDFHTKNELKRNLLGANSLLELHHIFPKSILYMNDFDKTEVNALANFTFLTRNTNQAIGNSNPSDYFANIDMHILESHWIPLDSELWKIENYRYFLIERRKMLAEATNKFLNALFNGSMPEDQQGMENIIHQNVQPVLQENDDIDIEDKEMLEINEWVIENGMAAGEFHFEISNSTNNQMIILDIAWPMGLQEELSQPVALLLKQSNETEIVASRLGYRCFVDINEFRLFVEKEILGSGSATE